MGKRTVRVWAEMCGAVIGAGFASGREIAVFFARYGQWSWLGVAAAAGTIGWLCTGLMASQGPGGMPSAWQGRWPGRLWRVLFAALLLTSGGAMLAAGGRVAALLIPAHGAEAAGLATSLMLGWLLSRRETPWLGRISQGLLLCLLLMIGLGLAAPAEPALDLRPGDARALLSGLCYGGFNMALAAPAAALAGSKMKMSERRVCSVALAATLALLLCCGNGVLLRHGALMDQGLPFIALLGRMGKWGGVLGGTALYLASLTTLTACLRGLRALWPAGGRLCAAGTAVLSLGGLEGLVGTVYPLLGGMCLLLLTTARCRIGTKM